MNVHVNSRTAVRLAQSKEVVSEGRIHPLTGKELRQGVRQQVVLFASLSRAVEVPGWYPEDGSDSLHSGADLQEADEGSRRCAMTLPLNSGLMLQPEFGGESSTEDLSLRRHR